MPDRELVREAVGSGVGGRCTAAKVQHKAACGPAEDTPSELAGHRLPMGRVHDDNGTAAVQTGRGKA